VMSDPTNNETITKLQFILNKDILAAVAAREQIIDAINRHYGQTETESVDSMLAEFTDTAIDFTDTEQTAGRGNSADANEGDAPIIRLVNLIIQEAVNARASDIHIEPFAERIRVRYRIAGCWSSATTRPAACWPRSSPASRSWPTWISPRSGVARTGASSSPCRAGITTCGSACYPPATVNRA